MKLQNTTQLSFCMIPQRLRFGFMILVAMLLLPSTHFAQEELARRYSPYNLTLSSSNPDQNRNSEEIITATISENGATWLRLFFKDINLGQKSTVTITSKLDGASQTLDAKTIKQWKESSAYFNGNEVEITLRIAPGESNAGLNVRELSIGELDPTVRSQCGSTDDRVDSADNAIGRIVPIGCTGWIITNGKLVTAGHCVGSRAEIIEFNVPKSNPDRTIVHPGPEDQYPIGNFVSPYPNSPSQANDWAVFTASANSQTGQLPINAQGKSFNVVRDNPGSNITITGFGTDTGIDNQTQQIHTGPLSSVTNTFVRYRTDTTGGNSGSPIIDTATGNAVGVHAYGGCSGSGGSNSGERATIPAFWDAMGLDSPPPGDSCTGDVDTFPYSESFEGSLGEWKQVTVGDDINWTVNSGGTPSDGTGPGNAVDGNSYIYVEASGNGAGYPNKNAILNSPCLDFSSLSSPTLSFQYHMTGNSVGVLDIQARTDNTGAWTSVFNRSGAQGGNWNEASIDLSSYSGNASVQLRLNVVTGSSWQGDISIDALSITNGVIDPPPGCDTLDFNDFQIAPFSNQDRGGTAVIVNSGAGLSMQSNTWKEIALSYTVTASTVIEFDFSSSSQGEIHAVGFEDDDALTPGRYFKVHGSQNYGVTNYDDYNGGTKKYTIPVGNFYTGSMNRFVFINDDDAGSGNTSIFSNVKIYEGSCNGSFAESSSDSVLESIDPIIGDESENSLSKITLTPNPANDIFSLTVTSNETVAATFHSIVGRKIKEVQLEQGVNSFSVENLSLKTGVYLVTLKNDKGDSYVQKLVVE